MDTLLALDRALFFSINHLPHTLFADWLAMFFSGVGSAGFVWLGIGFLLFLREEKKDHTFFLPLIFVVISCWVFVEGMLKYLVARSRPTILDGAIFVGAASSGFSFPSSHAAISWTMAVVLSRYEPKFSWAWYLLALIISISRIYLGVHYPLDVLVGALVGSCIGAISLRVFYKSLPRRRQKPAQNSQGGKRSSH